jgi:hypothetical protein
MEMIVLNLPDSTERAHELTQAERARDLALALRGVVAVARTRPE